MDVVYSIVEGGRELKKFENFNFPSVWPTFSTLGLQFFIPIVAIIVLLAVLFHYKGRLSEEESPQPENIEGILGKNNCFDKFCSENQNSGGGQADGGKEEGKSDKKDK